MTVRSTTEKQFTSLARIAASATMDDQMALASALQVATDLGLPHDALYETLLMLISYVGYPRTIHAMITMQANFPLYFGTRDDRVSEPWAAHAVGTWPMRGEHVFIQLWGTDAWAKRSLADLSPELSEWLIADSFGRIFGRPNLSLLEREIVVIGSLIAQGSLREIGNHRRAVLHLGGQDALLDTVVEGLSDIVQGENYYGAREALAKLRS